MASHAGVKEVYTEQRKRVRRRPRGKGGTGPLGQNGSTFQEGGDWGGGQGDAAPEGLSKC